MTNAETDRQQSITAARESFSGRTLTKGQFSEAWAISGVINREIHKSGSFREKLTDYAHAYARSEKFDALRGETILRDIYTGRFGQSMNQTREGLVERENNLPADIQAHALHSAEMVGSLIREGQTQPFYQAYDAAAVKLADEMKITQSGAKAQMKEAFKTTHGRDLYEAGKELEDAYHKPVREAEIASRKAEKLEARPQNYTKNRSMA